MPFSIQPKGLTDGKRLDRLSDEARLWFPHIFACSNSYSNFPLDYAFICSKLFSKFSSPPSEEEFFGFLREYQKSDLLFVFRSDEQVWGAWDDVKRGEYRARKDKNDPRPDTVSFENWQSSIRHKRAKGRASQYALSILSDQHCDSSAPQADLFGPQIAPVEISENVLQNSPNFEKHFANCTQTLTQTLNTQTQENNSNSNPDSTQRGGSNGIQSGLLASLTVHGISHKAECVGIHKPPPAAANSQADITVSDWLEQCSRSWFAFRQAADAIGMVASDKQWEDLETVTWPRLSITDQFAALAGITHKATREMLDGYVPKAVKYFAQRIWTEPERSPPKKTSARTNELEQSFARFDNTMLRKYGGQRGD